MKIYLVKRKDLWDYDEYDAFVVRAESKERAQILCQEQYHIFNEDNVDIKEVSNGRTEEIILGSFNAG